MDKKVKTMRRKKRVRVVGSQERPRLSVFRSNKYIYAQLINDSKAETLVGVSEKHLSSKNIKGRIEIAREVGKLIAEKAKQLKIQKVVFDRSQYTYKGKVKALAEGAREGGLQF